MPTVLDRGSPASREVALTSVRIVGQLVGGGAGGAILTVIVGLIKNARRPEDLMTLTLSRAGAIVTEGYVDQRPLPAVMSGGTTGPSAQPLGRLQL
jgi:hypothetical protein